MTNWVTSTVSKRVKLHAASGKRKREEKTRGDSPFSRWSPLVKVSLVKFNFARTPSTSSPGSSLTMHHIGKREDPGDEVGTQLSERLEKAIKCLRKKCMEVPWAHAVCGYYRCGYSNRDTWKKIIQLRFSKTKASLESWIFVGPFEKKLENLLFSKKHSDRIIFF